MKIIIRKNKQEGSILIISLLVLTVILSITFAVLGIFLPKIRIASDPIRSVVALYSADSGLEWCLYIYRTDPTLPRPSIPVIFSNNGVTLNVYYPSAGFTPATCNPNSELTLDYRSVGTYQSVARSLEIHGGGFIMDNPTSGMITQSGLSSFSAAQLVDGNTGTVGWDTNFSVAGAWLQIDLGLGNEKAYVQTRVYASAAGYTGIYSIQYYDISSSTWLDAVTGFAPSASGWNSIAWPSVGPRQYWRYLLTTPGAGATLNELEMYR